MTLTPEEANMRALNLAEYYLLTCIDHAGRLLTQQHTIRVGLAGAVLTDLARRGSIHVTQDLVTVDESKSVKLEAPLDSVLQIIRDSPEPQDAEQWVNRLSRPPLMNAITKILERNRQLMVKEKRLLGIWPRTRYILDDAYDSMDIYVRIRGTLMGRDTSLDATSWPLLQLLHSTNVLSRVFPGIRHKTVKERLGEFQRAAEELEPNMAEALQAVENAIAESLTATRGQATGLGG